ncbi:hypothetical protein [Streptomyces hoynatensis]|uniref:Uncharacterized protein n=1 Tax=Streptomyces hoynatensis TaxID=1141874 RepID=A0A3A9YXU2_9ACTN|nr:hypothetical protein [Streptomyces hoynatensis]RKN40765.1 hypothetical protein D7294_16875 [Streptomyces hoynatensis]
MPRLTPTTGQLQFPTVIHGTVNPAAGEAAKQVGTARAEAATDVSWAEACDAAIETMAARGFPFQAADLIAEGLVDEPEHPNQWGARFGAAARHGIIRDAGAVPSKRATVHKSLCKQWIGVRAARGEVAE